MLQARQLAEHRGAVLGIIVRDDFAHGLVIGDDTRRRRIDAKADGLAVDLDLVAELDALAHVGRLVVDRDAAFKNELLHFKARSQPGLGQHLVQLGRIDLGQQHALGRRGIVALFGGVELARDDVRKTVAFGRP